MSRPDFSRVKTATIRGKTFVLVWKGHATYRGRCDHPGLAFKQINISVDKDPVTTIGTVAHEALHAAAFDLGEEAVEEFERDFIKLLRRLPIKISYVES